MISEKVYYIGFSPLNGICNENFFKGSITVYPTFERGNIYYSDKYIEDTKSNNFINQYRTFVYKNAKEIQNSYSDVRFLLFNDKPKIKKLCSEMDDINIVEGNSNEVISFLNNKFMIRDHLKESVPILSYLWSDINSIDQSYISNMFPDTPKFVLQSQNGAGGNGTFLINLEDIFTFIKESDQRYCISPYKKHTPLNITLVIGEHNTVSFPPSVQLITNDKRDFKYIGGDFIYPRSLSKKVIKQINEYSMTISKEIHELGYRGLLGIDYIVCEGDEVFFMEINPRFQASSFIISRELEAKYSTCLAELHYIAINKRKLPSLNINKIDISFINSNHSEEHDKLLEFETVMNGYFRNNPNSVYRKIFSHSILLGNFEHL